MAHHNEFGVALPHQPVTTDVASLSISPSCFPTSRSPVASDRMPDHLGELLGRAESTARDLDRLIRTMAELSGAGHHAAAELQERLRLGVRMLQAFDVQIQRGEQAGQQLAAQLGPQLQAFIADQVQAQVQSQVEARVEAASQRAEAAIARSMEALEARRAAVLAQLDECAASIATQPSAPSHGAECDEIERRVRALVQDAELRLTALEARARALEARSIEAADGLLGTVGTATTLKELVGDEIREQRRLATETEAAVRELQGDLVALVERCTTVRSELNETLVRSLDLPRHPVEQPDAAPVRPAVNEDLLSFTQALRQLAAKAEQSFVNGRFDEFSPARPALSDDAPLDRPTSGPAPATPLPIDTRHLTAEILALDATSLLRSKPVA